MVNHKIKLLSMLDGSYNHMINLLSMFDGSYVSLLVMAGDDESSCYFHA